MATNKNPNQRQPGEKQLGTFHYNPGNMSGKTTESRKDRPRAASEARQNRQSYQDRKKSMIDGDP